MSHALDALVIEIDVRDFYFAGKAAGFHGKAVIVRSDFHTALPQVLDWLIAAPMSEYEFERLASKSAAQQLMSETDSKRG